MEHATFVLVEDDGGAHARLARASYDSDVHAWATQQAEATRLRRFHELDVENSADEVEDVARREREESVDRLSLAYQHLLKGDHQRERRGASRARTRREQRTQADGVLADNPSLRPHVHVFSEAARRQGRVEALNETGLGDADVPEVNPYSWQELMTRPVAWPEP